METPGLIVWRFITLIIGCMTAQGKSLFALKVLKAEDADAFALEVKALIKIKPKPHLVNAVTAFKYQDKYHLIFKWAEGGNLADFWKSQDPTRDLSHDSICWFAQQCHGLADGLDGIHNASISLEELENDTTPQDSSQPQTGAAVEEENQIHGRHGDIKPQNILWFSDHVNDYGRGVLKITDFGITAFHSARTTKVPAKYVQFTRTYAAPEIEVFEPNFEGFVSRPFDMWSLGCVYLEFITWILLGYEEVEKFAKDRKAEKGIRKKFDEDTFYSIHKSDRSLFRSAEYSTAKNSVISWINKLRDHKDCSQFFHEFLDYIQQKMLVDKESRENSAMVREKLSKMFTACKRDPEYASTRIQPKASRWREAFYICFC
ncbi:hypothetical protein INS49_007285 [Diaporthe citri]|uniref:uncharacterized protein n=1 Tax=Diaporthe citri TaxID=83186 RepID=UPI001C7EEE08|nr:uncharacterized protein INS49_007285 [Diaporthe citri]KAG6365674.1 hypothetical protein INS49_007285 [Diaporthe citri]